MRNRVTHTTPFSRCSWFGRLSQGTGWLLLNSTVTTLGGAAPPPTPFAELNELLGELVARVAAILGDNFVGAYLTGSFALGAADLHSDCDFLVVTEDSAYGRARASTSRASRRGSCASRALDAPSGGLVRPAGGARDARVSRRALAVHRPRVAGDAVVDPLQYRAHAMGAPRARDHARRPRAARARRRGSRRCVTPQDAPTNRELPARPVQLDQLRPRVVAALRRREPVPDALHARDGGGGIEASRTRVGERRAEPGVARPDPASSRRARAWMES